MIHVEMTRRALYELAWQLPLMRAATKIGVGEATLRRMCQSEQIPLPGRGWWTKAHQEPRPRAPKLLGNGEQIVVLRSLVDRRGWNAGSVPNGGSSQQGDARANAPAAGSQDLSLEPETSAAVGGTGHKASTPAESTSDTPATVVASPERQNERGDHAVHRMRQAKSSHLEMSAHISTRAGTPDSQSRSGIEAVHVGRVDLPDSADGASRGALRPATEAVSYLLANEVDLRTVEAACELWQTQRRMLSFLMQAEAAAALLPASQALPVLLQLRRLRNEVQARDAIRVVLDQLTPSPEREGVSALGSAR